MKVPSRRMTGVVAGAAAFFAAVSIAAAPAGASEAGVQTDAWPCAGPADFFAAQNKNGSWTCYANSGSSLARSFNTVHWQSGANSGYFWHECHGKHYPAKRFIAWQSESLGDCTIYKVNID
ncbi:hypothetical protein [Amycolatopsis keratiniphila]|uniref:Streptomyces killer toxin-like beta/gamma crystallin domain-containing protein n=1 Tax=Amycolatopsis keratiniphila subsp. keratiniphila TaxID=227715 RepID=A0A1W2LJV1_9PSEU|nr:hypothetical protein [Amycolatopsis keratiniphila]OLZ49621.1 hypothetical protein BS330_30245 [Amycolatopsis keratiniphila subsp. nogabecina]ONF63138.1 hypothetical protein AVR91_0235335 [Amycolatopsis keratiniphila subsp. keratiniphila]SDU22021.1 hypothetical protein SAMN04489733_2157 [Amycolatopsis keratiniphila]